MSTLSELIDNRAIRFAKFVGLAVPDASGNFSFDMASEWITEHSAIMAVCAAAYLPLVIGLGAAMKNREPFKLRSALIAWNLFLAFFSMAGFYRVAPLFMRQLTRADYDITSMACDLSVWTEKETFWLYLFCMSKVPEFVDTVFLRLRKRPVIFLHWFHHIATMAYCWFTALAAYRYSSAGLFFAFMNLGVHSVMYSYYAAAAAGYGRTLARRGINVVITTMQISQMAAGVATVALTASCPDMTTSAIAAAGSMYGAYLILFGKLFADKYCGAKAKAAPVKSKDA